MKKIALIIGLFFMCYSAFGQDVRIINDENVESYRKIQTDYLPLAKKGIVAFPFSLQYFSPTGSQESYYTLIFKVACGYVRRSLPEGSKMFVKLDDDSIIELQTISGIEEYENESETMPQTHSDYYYIYPTYMATPEQINQMIEHKIVKVRRQITWGEGYYDMPNENGRIRLKHMCMTENLARMKLSIDKRLEKTETPDDILNGF